MPTNATATATFTEYPDMTPQHAVLIANIGTCKVESLDRAPPQPIQPVFHSAGIVTIMGGTQTISMMPPPPSMPGSYTGYSSQSTPLWNGGEVISVTATGADVPPFTLTATA